MIRRCLRAAGIGTSLGLFGAFSVVLSIGILPVLWLAPVGCVRRCRWTQRLIHWFCRAFITFVQQVGLLKTTFKHIDRLDHPGALIVANHPSLMDVVLLLARLRHVDCVAKPSLQFNPATALAVRLAGYITQAEGAALIERCRQTLIEGRRLLIFPEGTRSVAGQALELKRGAARIALAADVPITPVIIQMHPQVLSKQQRWYHAPADQIRVRITVDTPIPIDGYRQTHGINSASARDLTRDLRDHFHKRLTEEPVDDAS